MENREVAWAMTLPLPLRGGPQSETQKSLRNGEFDEPNQAIVIATEGAAMPMSMSQKKLSRIHSKKVRASGAPAPGAICMKSIGYEGSVNKGHRNKPGYMEGGETKFDNTFGGATGQSQDNVIQSNKVVNTKEFDDHEGEYYASAPLVQILGGSKEIESILMDAARNKIRSKMAPNPNAAPILNKEDVGVAKAPGQAERPGFSIGGSVVKKISDYTNSAMATAKNNAADIAREAAAPDNNVGQVPAPSPITPPPALPAQQAPVYSAPSFSINTPDLPSAKPIPAMVQPTAPAPVAAMSYSANLPKEGDTKTANGNTFKYINGKWTAQTQAPAVDAETAAFQATGYSNPEALKAANLVKGKRALTAQEESFLKTATKEQAASFLEAEGLGTASATAPITATGAPIPVTQYDANVRAAMKMLSDYAAGINPVMDGIINETMQQYGSDTAAGLEALKMDLAGRGISGPAADAILASYDRNARIGENKLRGDFAQKVMEEAKAASGDLLSKSITLQDAERGLKISAEKTAYDRAQTLEDRVLAAKALSTKEKTDAMTAAFEAGDTKLGAALYQQIYGVALDTSAMDSAAGSKAVAKATTDILAALNIDASMTLDPTDTLGQQYLMPAVTAMWNAQHPGQPIDMVWANKFIEDFKKKNSDVYKMTTKYSEPDAVKLFFGGDQKAMDDFYNESTGESGYKGFQSALSSMFGTAITKGSDGNLVFNVDEIMKHFAPVKLGYQAGPGGAVANPGQDITIGTGTYKVMSKNADGTYTAIKDGKTYTITPGSSGKTWNEPEEKVESGLGVAGYRLDESGNPSPLTGAGDDASYQPVTWKGQQVMADINGESVNVYKRSDGTYHTDPTGGKDDVSITINKTTGEAKPVAYTPAALGTTVMISGVPAEATAAGGTGKLTALSNVGGGQIVKDSSVPPKIFFMSAAAKEDQPPSIGSVNITQFQQAYDAAPTQAEKTALITAMANDSRSDASTLSSIVDRLGVGNYFTKTAPASTIFDTGASDEEGNRWNVVGDISTVNTDDLVKWAGRNFSGTSISTYEEDDLEAGAIAELTKRAATRDAIKALSGTYDAETIKLLLKGAGGDFTWAPPAPKDVPIKMLTPGSVKPNVMQTNQAPVPFPSPRTFGAA
jgi:hypothetical protein